MNFIYPLDIFGTFAFAVFGSFIAQKKKLDIFGIFACAVLSALGGGTIRELILLNIPFYFFDNNYFYAIFLGVIFSLVTFKYFHKINKFMLLIDAVGLSTFAFIGASRADEYNLGAFGIIMLATLTSVGGGLIRDISIREIPQIFYSDFYASPAIILGMIYIIFGNYMNNDLAILGLIFLVFLIRVLGINFKIKLWVPNK